MFESCEINKKYIKSELQTLVPILEQQLMDCFEKGNDITAAQTLSQYGIVQLFLANHYATTVIYNQILDEYLRDQPDSRKIAVYSRFLGCYEAFHGNKDAAQSYYEKSLQQFTLLDWHATEAFMIVEAIYFYCLPYHDRSLLFQGIDRLQRLLKLKDAKHKDWIQRELLLIEHGLEFLQQPNQKQKLIEQLKLTHQDSYWFGSFSFWASCTHVAELLSQSQLSFMIQKTSRNLLPLDQFLINLFEIHTHFHQRPKLSDLAEQLKAKAGTFKHPWYCLVEEMVSHIYKNRIDIFSDIEKSHYYKSFSDNSIITLWKQHALNPARHNTATAKVQGLNIHLFGDHTLSIDGKKLDLMEWKSPHLREFFLYLVMHPQGRISTEIVMDELFSDDDVKKSKNRLYVSIHRVNRFLHDQFGIKEPFIQNQQGFVFFNQDLVEEIDLQVYRKLTSVANQLWYDDQEAAVELMQKANKIYQDELLSDFLYYDWLEKYRKSLQQTHGKLLKRLAAYYLRFKNKKEYEETSQQLIHLFPFNESLYHDYISYLHLENRQLEAHYWFNQLKTLLEKELGLAPSFDLMNR